MNVHTPMTLEMTRIFDAPPERVFDAWLGTEWGDWAGPRGIRGEVVQMEPRVGGRYRIVMHRPDGQDIAVAGAYHEIARPTKLVFSWKWEHETVDTLVTLTFRAVGGKTEMTIRHEGFSAQERVDGHKAGWTGSFDKLAEHLAGEKA